jgi:enamine deaminase RidA (YjgF/YER057c/UK114 family)
MRTWTVCLLALSAQALAAEPRCFGPNPAAGASAAVLVEDVAQAHTTQLLPTDEEGRIVSKDKVAVQIDRLLDNLDATLRGVDSGLDRVVKLTSTSRRPRPSPPSMPPWRGASRGRTGRPSASS